MSITRPNVTITTEVSNSCSSFYLSDTTGTYNSVTNPLGYGLPSGPTVNNVTTLTIVLNYDTQGTYITYAFTISSGTITAASLSVEGGTATNILSALTSTTFPMTNFDLVKSYGVTIPNFEDGIYSVDYTISGTVSGTSFSFTTSLTSMVPCATQCCIYKMFASIDPNCGCASTELKKANTARSFLLAAKYAAQSGNKDNAVIALNKASELCDGIGDCGCS